MQFSQKLDIKQAQTLTMSPQLQQAIKLLQMTNLELTAYLEEQFQNNPLLEISSEHQTDKISDDHASDTDHSQSEIDNNDIEMIADNSFSDSVIDRIKERVESKLDSHKNLSGGGDSDDYDHHQNISVKKDLRQHLSDQLYSSNMPQDIMLIASYLIGSLSDTGYLHETCAEIAATMLQPVKKVEQTLILCQEFEPAGVFARDLAECLKLQLIDKGLFDQKFSILLENLNELAANKFTVLTHKVGVTKGDLIKMIEQIRRLYPKPGLQYSNDPIIPVIPDVFISEASDGGWHVSLNQATMPKATLSQSYDFYLDRKNKRVKRETKKYLKESFSQASWLIRSLEQRNDTIMRVAAEILRQQDGFFAYGFEYLRPMNLKTVAEELELHESTVSRVTTGKYLRCPRGTFEMKFFFMSGITGSDGEATIASQWVKQEIKRFVADEDPKKILSDGDLVDLLQSEKDITIARRTVAKYREMMNIPSSVQRRRQKNRFI